MGLGREDNEAELEAGRQTSAGSGRKGSAVHVSKEGVSNRSQVISGIHDWMATP